MVLGKPLPSPYLRLQGALHWAAKERSYHVYKSPGNPLTVDPDADGWGWGLGTHMAK